MSDRCLFLKSGIRSEELGIKFRLWRVTEDLKLKNNNEISQSRCKGQVIYLLYIPESVKLMSPLRAAKGGFAVPLSFIELYFISISALVSQKVETPFLNPRDKPDFID